jgi:hypothetical protein
MHACYQTDKSIWIIMEFLAGGDLYDGIKAGKPGGFRCRFLLILFY